MAITINQQPTSPNGSFADLVWIASSNLSTEPQYKVVCDIKDNDGTLLSRVKQPVNNSGYAVFELSDIITDWLDYDTPYITTIIRNSNNENIRDFKVYFGEEYASSISGSTQIFNGNGSVGNPAVGGNAKTIIPAVEERLDGLNWNYSPYTASYLTNAPQTQSIASDEFGTLSHLNTTSSAVVSVSYTIYNEGGSTLASKTISNSFGTTNPEDKLIHIPIGPQNLSGDATLGSILTSNSWYRMTVTANSGLGTITYLRRDDCISENGTRFAFINRLGVMDYYTATLTKTENENYTSNSFLKNFIDFGTTSGTISFDKSRRGETIYNKEINSTYTAQTDWLTQSEADWLVELFQSPSVYIQYGDNFVPVIIINQSVDKKTNPRGQKLFTYQIQYKLANKKKNRR